MLSLRTTRCAVMLWINTLAFGSSLTLAAPPSLPFEETLGVNTHYAAGREEVSAEALQRLSAAGVAFVRNDLGWASIERSPGIYDFAGAGVDDLVQTAEENGMRILFILDYGNTLYGPAQAVLSDEGRTAFAAFAAAAAGRYGGRGHLWEIWNEPNLPQFWNGGGAQPDAEQYARLVDAAAAALRQADPSATILAGAAFMGLPELVPVIHGIEGVEFLRRLFAAGILERVDGITAHFYRGESPESVTATVDRIRALMQDTGRPLPLWSGEWGYSTYDPEAPATGINYLPAVSEARQASYAARMLLTNYSVGLAGSVWFKDRDAPDPSPGNIEHHFGLLRDDLEPKPSYQAVAALTQLLDGLALSGELILEEGEHGMIFENGSRRVTALWSESTAMWRLTSPSKEARVLARNGSEITLKGLKNGLQIRLHPDDGPIYLVGNIGVLPARSCAGDCSGDGLVTIDELTTSVGIALEAVPPIQCAAVDTNDDGDVAVGELIDAVQSAFRACSS